MKEHSQRQVCYFKMFYLTNIQSPKIQKIYLMHFIKQWHNRQNSWTYCQDSLQELIWQIKISYKKNNVWKYLHINNSEWNTQQQTIHAHTHFQDGVKFVHSLLAPRSFSTLPHCKTESLHNHIVCNCLEYYAATALFTMRHGIIRYWDLKIWHKTYTTAFKI